VTIRLSICIATLNRVAYIGETLNSIFAQIADEVEVVIVDGASTDGTEGLVTDMFRNRPNCHYHRLAEKGGVDQDYCRAVAFARGDYCWLMTDDDVLLPGAIATVLAHLREDPDLLVVNAEVADKTLTQILVPRKIRLKQDRDFASEQQAGLLALAGGFLSFIGSVVIRRSVWQAREQTPYFGPEFVPVGVIFQKPLDRFARVGAQPLIRIRHGNTLWAARTFDIWMFKWPALVWSFPHLSSDSKAAVCPREPWKKMFPLLLMKAQGYFSYREYRDKLASRQMFWFTRLHIAATAAFPDVLYNALLSILVPILTPWAKGTLIDLRTSRFDYRKCWLGYTERTSV